MKKYLFFLLCLPIFCQAQDLSSCPQVLLETDSGNIKIALYNETPLHRDNFLKLVQDGFYNGLLFHRVIRNFMIQTGDSVSRHAPAGVLLGDGNYETYKIPAEIRFPQLFHKRGCIAAAREPDEVNPEKVSSMCQFYIVWGKRMSSAQLEDVEERIFRTTHQMVDFTPELREAYYKYGGTPHLDAQYTVFGEIVEGLDVVDRIQKSETDKNDRPMTDIRIIRATIVSP